MIPAVLTTNDKPMPRAQGCPVICHLTIVRRACGARWSAAVDWQAPAIVYCFDLHPKMHPNFILRKLRLIKIVRQNPYKVLS